MNRFIKIMVLDLLVLSLVACASSGDKSGPPDWVDGSSTRYKSSAYVTGLGSADSLNAARDRARADLAKTFRVQIDEKASDLRRYTSDGSNETFDSKIERDLSVNTEQVLEGVTVPETWQHPTTGEYFAFAVLNRAQAGLRLRETISRLDASAQSMLTAARSTDDAFRKAEIALRVVENQRERAVVQSMLQAVDVTGRGVPAKWNLGELEADMMTALRRIELNAKGDAGWESVLRGVLSDSGFTVNNSGAYTVTLEVDIAELPKRNNWFWRRAVAVMTMTGADGEALGQQRWEFKESASDVATVELRLREAVAKRLRDESRDTLLGMIAN